MNTERIINNEIEKPCYKLGYCPYGSIVEEFKLRKKRINISCKIFGHDCPVFYISEKIKEVK